MIFVGYGVSAPERGWDDFKGQDLKGKVAVFLINDPDFVAAKGEDPFGKFGGRTMTYYGRWTYKRSEEHTSELQSLMRISYAVFCLKKKKHKTYKSKSV